MYPLRGRMSRYGEAGRLQGLGCWQSATKRGAKGPEALAPKKGCRSLCSTGPQRHKKRPGTCVSSIVGGAERRGCRAAAQLGVERCRAWLWREHVADYAGRQRVAAESDNSRVCRRFSCNKRKCTMEQVFYMDCSNGKRRGHICGLLLARPVCTKYWHAVMQIRVSWLHGLR